MAKYLVLIYGDEAAWASMPPEEEQRLMDGHRALAEAAGDAILDTGELEPPSAVVTLRGPADGEPAATTVPLADNGATLGGYYLLEAAGLDEAKALASLLHESRAGHGGVEIRPVAEG